MLLLVYFYHFTGALSAGGATIKRMVSNTLKLSDGNGTRIFQFEGEMRFKDVKKVVNSLGLTDAEEVGPAPTRWLRA
jgi:heme oxygenase